MDDSSTYACQSFFENLDFDNTYSSNQYSDTHNLNDIFSSKSRLTVLHANMRSLVKNFYKLEELIVELKKTLDIIAITETWLDNTKLNKVSLQGYQLLNENSINADAGKMGQAGKLFDIH